MGVFWDEVKWGCILAWGLDVNKKVGRSGESTPPGRPAFRSIKPSIPLKKFEVSKPIHSLFLTLRYRSFSF
jgi:hypothetical protein